MKFYPHIKRRSLFRQELCIILLILMPFPSQSAPFFEVYGNGHASDGFSARYANNPSSIYFNPAQMDLHKGGFTTSLINWMKRHKIRRASRPNGYDVPPSVFEARIDRDGQLYPLEFRPLPTSEVNFQTTIEENQSDNFFVLSTSKVLLKDRLSFGVMTLIPLGSFQEQKPYFVDENAQFFDNKLHFEHLSGKFGNLVLTSALAVKIVDGIRLGMGLTLSTHSDADPKVFVSDAANTERSLTLSQIKVSSAFTPHFGVTITPTENWNIGATAHLPYQSSVNGQSRLRFWDQGAEEDPKKPVEFEFAYDYLPLRISLGTEVKWRINETEFSLSGGVLWQQWSEFVDRVGQTPRNFEDTLTPEVKLAINGQIHEGQVSARFMPSSIPEQDGRTNYVDNEQVAVSTGYQYRLLRDGYNIIVGGGITLYHLLPRTHAKRSSSDDPVIDELPDSVSIRDGQPIEGSQGLQTNNPGFPSYQSSGFGLMSGLKIGVEL